MKTVIVFFSIISCLFITPVFAQISHGGKPLPYLLTRSAENLFESMPSFDLQEQLRLDSMEYNGLRNFNRLPINLLLILHLKMLV